MKTRWQQIRSKMPTTLADLINDVGLDKARAQLETQWRAAVRISDVRQEKMDEAKAELYREYSDFDTPDGRQRYFRDWWGRILASRAEQSMPILSPEEQEKRIAEMKAILHTNHPDKGDGADMDAFHAAAEELRMLRN